VRQGSAEYCFRPRGGISFVPAPESIHILDIFCASVPQALAARLPRRPRQSRRTFGQSTSSSGSTQGSASAAVRHSLQAGSAIAASM